MYFVFLFLDFFLSLDLCLDLDLLLSLESSELEGDRFGLVDLFLELFIGLFMGASAD